MEKIAALHVAWSTNRSHGDAVSEAVEQALEKAEAPVLGLVFSSGDWDRKTLAHTLAAEFGSIPWGGCTATAVIADRHIITEGIAVGVISAPQAFVGVGVAGPVSQSPLEAGASAVARAIDHLPPMPQDGDAAFPRRAVWLLVDSFLGSGSAVVRGAVREGGVGICWAGGGVGGKGRLSGRMSLLANGRAVLDRAVAVALDLPSPVGAGMGHGLKPFGPAMSVTKARGEVVEQLDYMPAAEVFERIARREGGSPDDASASLDDLFHRYPLGIPHADDGYLICDPFGKTDDDGLTFIAPVYEGTIVRLMRASASEMVAGAAGAVTLARSRLRGRRPGGLLVADCDGRFLSMGSAFQDEVDAMADAAGEGVPMLGCTAYGEIGRLGDGSYPHFHNKTVQILALPGEEAS